MGEPFVSPYLNLIRPGGEPGLNYVTLVQPMLQQQRNTQIQSGQIRTLDRQIQQQEIETAYGPMTQMRPTGGFVATFGNYSHFYPSKGQGVGAGRAGKRNYPNPLGQTGGFGMGGFGFGGGF